MPKKILGTLICLVVMLVLITGCGGNNSGGGTPAPQESGNEPQANSDEPSSADSSGVPAEADEAAFPSVSEILAKSKTAENEGMYFEYDIDMETGAMEGKTWVKGNMIKNEITMEDQIIISIINMDQDEAYTYMPAENIAIKTDIDLSSLDGFHRPTEYTDELSPDQYEILETTVYDGRKCWIIISTNDQVEMKMWVSEEYGIPLRIEAEVEGFKTVIEYKNIQIGSVGNDVFTLPPDVEIMPLDINMGDILGNF